MERLPTFLEAVRDFFNLEFWAGGIFGLKPESEREWLHAAACEKLHLRSAAYRTRVSFLSALARRRDEKGRWMEACGEGEDQHPDESHTRDWRASSHHTPAGFWRSGSTTIVRASNHTPSSLLPFEDERKLHQIGQRTKAFLFILSPHSYSCCSGGFLAVCGREGRSCFLFLPCGVLRQTPPDYRSSVSGGLCVTPPLSSITQRAGKEWQNLLFRPETHTRKSLTPTHT